MTECKGEQELVKLGKKAYLGDWDSDCTGKYESKELAMPIMGNLAGRIAKLQYLLFAENKHAMLVVLQAMDAGWTGTMSRPEK